MTRRIILLAVWAAGVAGAQMEEPQGLALRAAQADALRNLTEVVHGLKIRDGLIVHDLAAESPALADEIGTFAADVRFGRPQYLGDGTCEVAAEVDASRALDAIRRAYARHYRGSAITSADLEAMSERMWQATLAALGRGGARADLPPGLPPTAMRMLETPSMRDKPAAGSASTDAPAVEPPAQPMQPQPPLDAAGDEPPTAAPRTSLPAIWEGISAQGRLMALEAARMDAQRRLAQAVMGLRITAAAQLRDASPAGDTVRSEVMTELRGVQEMQQYLRDDDLIAEVTLRLPAEEVERLVRTVWQRAGEHPAISATFAAVEATGMGVPPARFRRPAAPTPAGGQGGAAMTPAEMPEWATRTLTAVGAGTDAEFSTPQGKLRAARAAETDARRAMLEQVRSLLPAGAASMPVELEARLSAAVAESAVSRTTIRDRDVETTIELPGVRVWSVVRDARR